MTIGAVFRNGPNTVQIGSDYANHALLTSGTFNLNANQDIPITVTATAPIIAFTGNWPIAVLSTTKSGNTWTFNIYSASNPASGKYYIFDVVQAGSLKFPFGMGLIIRNPTTGAVTYRSDLKYLRVVSMQTMDMPTPLKFGEQTQALSQSGLAAVIANPGGRIVVQTISIRLPDGTSGDVNRYFPYQLAAVVNDTTLLYGSADTRFTSDNEGNDQLDVPCTLMLIDISNFDV
jgi:hypothetical protein